MAAEIASSVAANAAGNVATVYALPYVSYFFRFGKIVEEFKKKRKQLELKKDRVKNDVDVAIRQTEVIEKDVQEWLEEAEKELRETQKLEAEIECKKCFDCCPTLGWRYCLSKKVAEKTPYINELLQRSDFQRVSIRPPLQGIEFFPSIDFQSSESSNLAFRGIMRALNTSGVNMIGLYGMPGVGKTTLAKEVGKYAKEQKLFDNVVMVTMSQTPNISNIQGRVAELLGLEFKASTEKGKAEELWRGLKGVKKILIIIDDVWNEFRLKTIGIPFGVEHKGCKILLTMRLQQVCVRMNCQEKFQLNVLSKDEAWALFKVSAGLKDVSSKLNDVAKEVASECKGLPLAIVIIGKALKGANLNGWKAANERLKESRHLDNEDVCEGLYERLKLSYDYLKGDNIRSCFLLCSVFPEDFDIGIEWLIMFGIGYGLFSNVYLIESLRMEIQEALRILQESGLLLGIDRSYKNDGEIYVRMHDVIRDLAHWITLREKNIYMVKEGLTEWPMSDSFEYCTSISFWNNKINNFPDKLIFPRLKILVFEGKSLVKVPSVFFEGMKTLRILRLRRVGMSLEVFKSLKNLRTRCFEYCELEDISSLRNLKNLEILALLETNIFELPEDLALLHGLKSLFFSYSGSGNEQSNFPLDLLSRLTSLQELHVTCTNNIKLSELNSLSRLTALSLRVSTTQCFQEKFVFPKLQRYMIAVNQGLREMERLKFRTLAINGLSSPLTAFKELYCNVGMLALDRVKEHKNIVPDVDQEGLNELISLHLKSCNDVECLMDMTGEKRPTTAFSNLVELKLKYMPCLKELCQGSPPISFLQNEEISETTQPESESIWKLQSTHHCHASLQSLKHITIGFCNKLKSIFSTCVAQSLFHLEQLDIFSCDQIEEVFDIPQEMAELEVPPLSNLTSLMLEELPELKWIWKEPTHFLNLQSLKTMTIKRCMKLAYLFTTPLAQSLVHLEELCLWSCHSLKHVIMEESENEDEIVSTMNGDSLHQWLLPKLTTLEIRDCPGLKYVFQIPLVQVLEHLKSISVTNSPQLKHVFDVAKVNNGVDRGAVELPRLQHLQLENLKILSCFCSENCPIVSPSLEKLIVGNCPRLEIFSIQQEVYKEVQLKELRLSTLGYYNFRDTINCEIIFQIQVGQFISRVEDICLTRIYQLEGPIQVASLHYLRELNVSKCTRLKSLFSSMLARNLPLLNILHVEYCDELEEIIEMDQTSVAASSKAHCQPIIFPSLQVIRICWCNNLKSLFPLSVTYSLPKLRDITIHWVSKLEHVFGYQGELNVEDDQKEIVLPELEDLKLSGLQNLKSFSVMGYRFRFPSLDHFEVTNCPKLTTSFNRGTPISSERDDQSTCNDIAWRRRDMKDQIPLYMNVGETKIILHKEMKTLRRYLLPKRVVDT